MQSDLHGVIGILGFGVDGRAVAEFLNTQPNVKEVRVFDDAQHRPEGASLAETSESKGEKESDGKLRFGKSLDGVSLLFRSPGFPLTHPLVIEAKERGIPIISSTSHFLQHFPGITVGITGSNGKTTCTSLIAEMLRTQFGRERVEEGGNDRLPRLDLLGTKNEERKTKNAFAVLELSSFQLIDYPVSPNVAVVLNITPNHLDWHASMEEYIEAKRHIVGGTGLRPVQRKAITVLNQDDPIVKTFADYSEGNVHWFSDVSSIKYQVSRMKFKTHPSTINAAVTTARALGVSEENIMKVLSTFRGVPHRIECVRELDGVKWHNDSSCTTPESAITACEAFPEGALILLLGGRDKGMDFSKLYKVIETRNVRVVSYGEMTPRFVQALPRKFQIPNSKFQDFGATIDLAHAHAKPGDNVVLSPACASFDMFANAKERGRMFEEMVRKLSSQDQVLLMV